MLRGTRLILFCPYCIIVYYFQAGIVKDTWSIISFQKQKLITVIKSTKSTEFQDKGYSEFYFDARPTFTIHPATSMHTARKPSNFSGCW